MHDSAPVRQPWEIARDRWLDAIEAHYQAHLACERCALAVREARAVLLALGYADDLGEPVSTHAE